MTRFARAGDWPELMSIWQARFGDNPELIFSKLQKPENILVMTDEIKISAMLSLRDFTLASPSGDFPAAYIYGVATAPGLDGKGCATALLDEAHGLLAQRGLACSALVPAGEGLFEFYRKRGYETAFSVKTVSLAAGEMPRAEAPGLLPVTPERFAELREVHLSENRMFVRFPKEYLAYIIEESRFYGGGAVEFLVSGSPCLAVFHRHGDEVIVRELAAPNADEAIAAFMSAIPAKRYVFRLAADTATAYANNLLPFGMLRWYDSNAESLNTSSRWVPAYLAHALD